MAFVQTIKKFLTVQAAKAGSRWLLRALQHILFPTFCTACKDLLFERKALCCECAREIKPVVSTKLIVTQKYAVEVHAVGLYDGPLRQLILAKSYSDRTACYYMAQLMYEHLIEEKGLPFDYIIFIPLHWTRYAKRGYNQSQEIARYISRWSKVPIANIVSRTKRTPFQVMFDKAGRQSNVKDAFSLRITKDQFKDFTHKRFLLIDDVMTTGATLQAVARELLVLKPLAIKACVLARTSG